MTFSLFTLTSSLHDADSVDSITRDFLYEIGLDFDLRGADFSTYGGGADIIYVRTGGTEGIFRSLYPSLRHDRPFYLLTSGKSNSLAASMEILSWLRGQGLRGEILHGETALIRERLVRVGMVEQARKTLSGSRYGVIGAPSDWLIASNCDREALKRRLGIGLVDIPMEELLSEIASLGPVTPPEDLDTVPCQEAAAHAALLGAYAIYKALHALVDRYSLSGLTLRCFDLLSSVHNTGCLALSLLNAEGIVAACEGDIPALISMAVANALTGSCGFQCNPAEMSAVKEEILFAHCTLPMNMARKRVFDTHFESGIGLGIHGELAEGPVTVFKLSGKLDRHFACNARLLQNEYGRHLCRTQIRVRFPADSAVVEDYFLKDPIANHHIVIPGHCAELIDEFLA
ncbi:MAG: hypothetical protein IJV01_06850 [Bacteroidales bacterium]|nr:hypothetical protein [Bacteroidales bacterium]